MPSPCSASSHAISVKAFRWRIWEKKLARTTWPDLFKYILFCFILLFTSSLPCRKDQFAVLYFPTSLIVLIQVYNWEIRHHSLVCCCGFADILNIVENTGLGNFVIGRFRNRARNGLSLWDWSVGPAGCGTLSVKGSGPRAFSLQEKESQRKASAKFQCYDVSSQVPQAKEWE